MERRVKERIQNDFQKTRTEKTKLRFIENVGKKEYIEKVEYTDCITIIKIRLNMIETKCNFKGNFRGDIKCHICKGSDDTTEHLLECPEFEWTREGFKKEDLDILNPCETLAKYVRHNIKLREENGSKIEFGKE